MQQAVERVRGFYDVHVAWQRRTHAVVRSLLESFRLADFQPIDVPVVEHLDLYLRKNGAQVLPKVYTFTDRGKRELALRPEFTASVIRALAPQVHQHGGTLRVSYAGPVFRYEKPQRATGRQFTQTGVEWLGAGGVLAEAEVLALACRSARELGVAGMRLVIGHLGPLRALLRFLEADGYAEQYLLEHLEYFNRGPEQQAVVRRRLGVGGAATGGSQERDDALAESLAGALRRAAPDEARQVVAAILDQMGLDLRGSTRTPDEILDRVLLKARRRAAQDAGRWREHMERALTFIERLGEIRGEPSMVLGATEELLARYSVPDVALGELRDVIEALRAYDLGDVTIELAPAMARGIAYYSGLIFEIYAPSPDGSGLQICGGGRYDGLAQALTGHECPALGFAFGVERVLHVLAAHLPPRASSPRIVVTIAHDSWRASALALAATLRRRSLACALQESDQPITRLVEHARRMGYSAAIVLPGAGGRPSLHVLEASAFDAQAQDLLARLVGECAPGAADAAPARTEGEVR